MAAMMGPSSHTLLGYRRNQMERRGKKRKKKERKISIHVPACVQSARSWSCRSCVRVDSTHNVRHVSEVDTGVHFEARAESVGERSSRGGVFYSVSRKTNSPPHGDLIYCEAFVGENVCINLKM